MTLTEEKKIRHVAVFIAFAFIGSAAAFGATFFFPPPDFTQDPPVYSEAGTICIEISTALYILGCTIMGLKLAEERKLLPAAGFTMMAITQGIVFVLDFMNANTMQNLIEGYKTYCGSMYLLVPAMVLISFYSEYPRWVKLLGIAACIPLVIVYFKFMCTYQYDVSLDYLSFFSLILFNLTALIWGIYAFRNARIEINNLRQEQPAQ